MTATTPTPPKGKRARAAHDAAVHLRSLGIPAEYRDEPAVHTCGLKLTPPHRAGGMWLTMVPGGWRATEAEASDHHALLIKALDWLLDYKARSARRIRDEATAARARAEEVEAEIGTIKDTVAKLKTATATPEPTP